MLNLCALYYSYLGLQMLCEKLTEMPELCILKYCLFIVYYLMKNFIKKVLQADQWAHHHTALVLTGVFLSGFMAFWQLFVPTFQTHAANLVCGTAFNIAVPVSECQALVDLYTYTNGGAWTNNTNWNTDTNICLWEGIGCTPADGSGFAHVQIIDLDENNLNGSVPQTIGNLPYLTSVALYRNNNLVVNLEIFQ